MRKRGGNMINDIFACRETGMIQQTRSDTQRDSSRILGPWTGAAVTVISELNGNLIVNIKDSRVAINKEMAKHVMVQ